MKKTSRAYVKKCWKRLLFYFGFLGLIYLVLNLYNIRQDALGIWSCWEAFFASPQRQRGLSVTGGIMENCFKR